ncbi:Asp23/Gls24 family envelope stress response protein [Streptomyces sp. NPDC008238]
MALDGHTPPPPEPGCSLDAVRRYTGDEVLTCGRTLSYAWEQARDTAPNGDLHLAACPYCREAVEGLAALNAATKALRGTEPPSTHDLVSRVMDIVRNEVRLGPMLPLNDPARALQIAENTAAAVLRRAADSIPGVTTASCRLSRSDGPAGIRVSVTMAASLLRPLPETAELVRCAIESAANRALGLELTAVDVTVIEIQEAVGAPPAAVTDGRQAGIP